MSKTKPLATWIRAAVKAVLGRVLDEEAYVAVQAYVMAQDIRHRRYREPELALIAQAVREGDCVVDVGANYGLYSYHLSRAVGARGEVLALEPIPFTAAVLRRVVRILDLSNVKVIPIGCSDYSGAAEFTVPIQANGAPIGGLAHLATRQDDRSGVTPSVKYKRKRLIRCDVAPLDNLAVDADISFLKIDVEGAELAVLRGAVGILSRCTPTVVCEVNPWLMEGFGYDPDGLKQLVKDLGYSIYWYAHPNLVLPFEGAGGAPNNWILVHQNRINRLATIIDN